MKTLLLITLILFTINTYASSAVHYETQDETYKRITTKVIRDFLSAYGVGKALDATLADFAKQYGEVNQHIRREFKDQMRDMKQRRERRERTSADEKFKKLKLRIENDASLGMDA